MHADAIKDVANQIEFAWTEWADEVVSEQAHKAVTELRELVRIIRSNRLDA